MKIMKRISGIAAKLTAVLLAASLFCALVPACPAEGEEAETMAVSPKPALSYTVTLNDTSRLGIVLVALYESRENMRLIEVKTYIPLMHFVSDNSVDDSFTSREGSYVRAFWWSGFGELVPLAEFDDAEYDA